MSKHLRVEPSPEWFRENIHAIADRLKKETTASVAFCSLPLIGEDPTSAVALQSELNRRIGEYSGRMSHWKEDVGYVPSMRRPLCKSGHRPEARSHLFDFFRFITMPSASSFCVRLRTKLRS